MSAIQPRDFTLAMGMLHRLTDEQETPLLKEEFSPEYSYEDRVTTTLKILHKAVSDGDEMQREELSLYRHQIVALNELIKNDGLAERVQERVGPINVSHLQGVQIAAPKTCFEKMLEIATFIPRVVISILLEIAMIPIVGILLLFCLTEPNFDPEVIKRDKTPILLLHGSGFNQSEWVYGRQFLKKDEYGSVFSMNFDGLASNCPNKGIDDYALKVRAKAEEIKRLTGQEELIIIGHSMGTLVGEEFAQKHAASIGVKVSHVMSMGTPWGGAPPLELYSEEKKPKRYKHMSIGSEFRQNLVNRAVKAERAGLRKFYCIGATTDPIAPEGYCNVTEDPRRQKNYMYLGHYSLAASTRVWLQVRSWLDHIYMPSTVEMAASVVA